MSSVVGLEPNIELIHRGHQPNGVANDCHTLSHVILQDEKTACAIKLIGNDWKLLVFCYLSHATLSEPDVGKLSWVLLKVIYLCMFYIFSRLARTAGRWEVRCGSGGKYTTCRNNYFCLNGLANDVLLILCHYAVVRIRYLFRSDLSGDSYLKWFFSSAGIHFDIFQTWSLCWCPRQTSGRLRNPTSILLLAFHMQNCTGGGGTIGWGGSNSCSNFMKHMTVYLSINQQPCNIRTWNADTIGSGKSEISYTDLEDVGFKYIRCRYHRKWIFGISYANHKTHILRISHRKKTLRISYAGPCFVELKDILCRHHRIWSWEMVYADPSIYFFHC